MGLKKLAYILFIFLISILHTLTLTTWLAKGDSNNITEVNERGSLKNSADSILASKRNISAVDLEINQLNK